MSQHIRRRDRLLRERVHDPYRLRRKLKHPAVCTRCGAVYLDGRWCWSELPAGEAKETLCQACHRSNDDYPAGEVRVTGRFAAGHREEILSLARNLERTENAEHPLNRIMRIEDIDGGLRILTTDIHLPHAIGHALKDAWEGELATHYDEQGYFARIEWSRDA